MGGFADPEAMGASHRNALTRLSGRHWGAPPGNE
jgi:hypothetical protein